MLSKGMIAAGAVMLAVLSSGTAQAQDVDHDWSGFYIGVTGGYALGTAAYSFNQSDFAPAGESMSHGLSGMPLGGYAGFNFQSPGSSVVYGIEASVQSAFAWVDGWDFTGFYEGDSVYTKIHYWGTLGPRVGYATGRLLFFGEAGVAFGHVISDAYVDLMDEPASLRESELRFGYFAGLGVDFAINDRISVGVGVRHIRLAASPVAGEFTYDSDGVGTGFYGDHEVRTRFTSLLVRLSISF